jgi:hypothetical protein
MQQEEIVSWGAQPLSSPFLPSTNRPWRIAFQFCGRQFVPLVFQTLVGDRLMGSLTACLMLSCFSAHSILGLTDFHYSIAMSISIRIFRLIDTISWYITRSCIRGHTPKQCCLFLLTSSNVVAILTSEVRAVLAPFNVMCWNFDKRLKKQAFENLLNYFLFAQCKTKLCLSYRICVSLSAWWLSLNKHSFTFVSGNCADHSSRTV